MQLIRYKPTINLALQGGGAHGAFTWGALDRLLENENFNIGWISGTSAGAVNAVAIAAGLAEGGRAGARAKLKEVWDAVARAGVPDLIRLNPFFSGLYGTNAMARMTSLWSPYDLNPLGLDPFRVLLEQTIDFELIRKSSPVELLIAATSVSTGQPRIFRTKEMTLEAVLASACLPTLHHTVEIDGEGYWDGGFSKNPDLVTLASESPYQDTLLIVINPVVKDNIPTGARGIAGTINRLTFNAPLLRDIELIEAVRETHPPQERFRWRSRNRYGKLANHRFHLIDAGRYTASLPDDSKMKPDSSLLKYLRRAGESQANKWLGQHLRYAGRKSTVDLKKRFLSPDPDVPIEPEIDRQMPLPAFPEDDK